MGLCDPNTLVLVLWGGRNLGTMDEEVQEMLAKLKFSKEESRKIFTLNSINPDVRG